MYHCIIRTSLSTAEQGRDGCIDGWADAIIGEGFPNVPTLALK